MTRIVESIKIADAGKSGKAKCRPYPLGRLSGPQRRQVALLVGSGCSLAELLVLIFHIWLRLSELRTAAKLGLPYKRTVELRHSIHARFQNVKHRRDRRSRLIAEVETNRRGRPLNYHCVSCGCKFQLAPLDARICPDCLTPLPRAGFAYHQKKSSKAVA